MTDALTRIEVSAKATYLEKCAEHDFEPTGRMLAEHGEHVRKIFSNMCNKTHDELSDLAQKHGVALADVLEICKS